MPLVILFASIFVLAFWLIFSKCITYIYYANCPLSVSGTAVAKNHPNFERRRLFRRPSEKLELGDTTGSWTRGGKLLRIDPELDLILFHPEDEYYVVDEPNAFAIETIEELIVTLRHLQSDGSLGSMHVIISDHGVTVNSPAPQNRFGLANFRFNGSDVRCFQLSSVRRALWTVQMRMGVPRNDKFEPKTPTAREQAALVIECLELLGEAGSCEFFACELADDAVTEGYQQSLNDLWRLTQQTKKSPPTSLPAPPKLYWSKVSWCFFPRDFFW